MRVAVVTTYETTKPIRTPRPRAPAQHPAGINTGARHSEFNALTSGRAVDAALMMMERPWPRWPPETSGPLRSPFGSFAERSPRQWRFDNCAIGLTANRSPPGRRARTTLATPSQVLRRRNTETESSQSPNVQLHWRRA